MKNSCGAPSSRLFSQLQIKMRNDKKKKNLETYEMSYAPMEKHHFRLLFIGSYLMLAETL